MPSGNVPSWLGWGLAPRGSKKRVKFSIPCGSGEVFLTLPEAYEGDCRQLDGSNLPPLEDPAAALGRALSTPLSSPPLSELAKGKSSACVVVSDITRPVPNRLLLPPLLATLERAGIAKSAITILIATGMHRPNLGRELDELLGRDIAANWRVVNHDCRDHAAMATVADLAGHPMDINRLYLDADLKIVTGLIEPHPFAGFSGGAKSVLPGLASLETMRFLHSYKLVAHPRVRSANLGDNPFQEHLNLAAEKAGLDFMLNVVLNRQRQVAGVFCGSFPHAFQRGCRLAAKGAILEEKQEFGLVVTSGGGHPLDDTLYQSSKGLDPARRLARTGGEALWIAGCRDGVGSREFYQMAAISGGAKAFGQKYSDPDNFTVDQWGAQVFHQCLEHLGRVHIYAPGLERNQIKSLGLHPVEDLQQTWLELCERHRRIAVLPEGPYLSVA